MKTKLPLFEECQIRNIAMGVPYLAPERTQQGSTNRAGIKSIKGL
jgi:hypothetical protein